MRVSRARYWQLRIERVIEGNLHPLVHPGVSWKHRYRFASNGCIFCRRVFAQFPLPAFEDQSSITISNPEPGRRGLKMTATAKRQFDDLVKRDPEVAAKVQSMIDDILNKDD